MNEGTRKYVELIHDLVYKAWFAEALWGNQEGAKRFFFEYVSFEIYKRMTMAKKAAGQAQYQKPEYTQVKWVNRQLSSDEKEQHDSGNSTPQKTFKDLLALALGGYNISLKWDNYSKCYQATLIPFNEASPNYGFGLSARAAEPYRAISLLLFKHYEVLQEDWQQAYKPAASDFEG